MRKSNHKNSSSVSHDPRKNYCFACGQDNHDGMKLKFHYDEERNRYVCNFRLSRRYTGPPGYCHGGIIATILDDAMSKVNRLRKVVALTSQITVQYLRPVPLRQRLRVEAYAVRARGRRLFNEAEIVNEAGKVLARSRGIFVVVDPEKVFQREI